MLPEACQGKKRKKTLIKWGIVLIILLVLLAIIGLVGYWIEKNTSFYEDFFAFIASTGLWGNLVLVILLAILNFPFTFGWMLVAMICGFLYKFIPGLITVIIGSTIGALMAFIFLRRFLRRPAMNYIERKGGYVARAIMYELRNHQVKVSLMVRAGPVPPGLQNAILAVSPMSLPLYTLTTVFGMLIKEVPYVYIGSSFSDLLDANSSSPLNTLLLILGAIAVVGMFVFILWVSRKAMEDAKKLKLKEEAATASSNLLIYPIEGSEETLDEDFNQLLSKKLQHDPFQQSDPVLNFFGLGYNMKVDDDDEYFSSDDEKNASIL